MGLRFIPTQKVTDYESRHIFYSLNLFKSIDRKCGNEDN